MERAVPILPADDLAVAKKFYVDGLGFHVTFEASYDEGRAGLLGVARGGIELTIDCPMDGHGRKSCVSIHVDDVDAYYREWSARVPGVNAPKNEEWGARTFDLQDPADNTLFVMGPVPEEASLGPADHDKSGSRPKVNLTLENDDALVLFELLVDFSDEPAVVVKDNADRLALCHLGGKLESTLVEPFMREYDSLVAQARARLMAEAGTQE